MKRNYVDVAAAAIRRTARGNYGKISETAAALNQSEELYADCIQAVGLAYLSVGRMDSDCMIDLPDEGEESEVYKNVYGVGTKAVIDCITAEVHHADNCTPSDYMSYCIDNGESETPIAGTRKSDIIAAAADITGSALSRDSWQEIDYIITHCSKSDVIRHDVDVCISSLVAGDRAAQIQRDNGWSKSHYDYIMAIIRKTAGERWDSRCVTWYKTDIDEHCYIESPPVLTMRKDGCGSAYMLRVSHLIESNKTVTVYTRDASKAKKANVGGNRAAWLLKSEYTIITDRSGVSRKRDYFTRYSYPTMGNGKTVTNRSDALTYSRPMITRQAIPQGVIDTPNTSAMMDDTERIDYILSLCAEITGHSPMDDINTVSRYIRHNHRTAFVPCWSRYHAARLRCNDSRRKAYRDFPLLAIVH